MEKRTDTEEKPACDYGLLSDREEPVSPVPYTKGNFRKFGIRKPGQILDGIENIPVVGCIFLPPRSHEALVDDRPDLAIRKSGSL